MIDNRFKFEIARHKLINSAAETLNLDRAITRFIKSGSKCSFRCLGGTYKLLRGYPPSPPLGKFDKPFSRWRGVLFFILVLSLKI